jgi:general secretion pathway protein C
MGFDAGFKRYFVIVVCLLIGVAAYFQASGMGQLVAASVTLDPSATPVAGPPAPHHATPPAAGEHAVSAQAIISRNPFDSVTGPLDGKPAELPVAQKDDSASRDPYTDPPCDMGKVIMIIASDEPQWSFATLAGSDGKTVLRRQGDEFAGHTVFFIGDLRSEDERQHAEYHKVYDRVWLQGSGTRCQMEVGGKVNVKPAAPSTPSHDAATPSGRKRKVPDDIANGIHKVSETEFNVDRAVVDKILENQSDLMKSARIVPEKEGDKIVGIRLFGIRQDSLLGVLGLENGDRLSSINGFEMSDPQKALEAYAKLRTADKLTVSVNRKGKPMEIGFNIK